ncbi:MAG: hypothetical protein ACRD80_05105, partial [Nitrososphaeraceae archaeon]
AVPCIVSGLGVPFISTPQDLKTIKLIANIVISTKTVITVHLNDRLVILLNDHFPTEDSLDNKI